jgi:hypothetical protein
MVMDKKIVFFKWLVIISVAIRMSMVFFVPFGQTVKYGLEGLNDEPAHFNYIKYLGVNKTFPVQTEHVQMKDSFKNNTFEYYQPPLYYMVSASLYGILGEKGTFYFSRLLSFIAGLITLILFYKIMRLMGTSELAAYGALLFFSLNFTNAYFSSLISNDSFGWLTCSLLIYYMVSLYKTLTENPDRQILNKHIRTLGIILAIGMVIKSSIVVFYPVIFIYFVMLAVKFKSPKIINNGIFILLAASVLVSPWYLRNYILYKSIFALEVGFGPSGNHMPVLSEIYFVIIRTIQSFWFPMQHLQYSIQTKFFTMMISVICFAHAAVAFYFYKKIRKPVFLEIVFMLIVASTAAAYISLHIKWCNPEARYLFQALIPIVYFMFVPLSKVVKDNWFISIVLVESILGYGYLLFV